MNRFQTVPLVLIAGISIFTAHAQGPRIDRFTPTPAYRVQTLKVKAKGLLPNTAFTVYLAADSLGEITTNADGRGSIRAKAIMEGDSFRTRPPAVLRFSSSMADDLCFAPVYGEAEDAALIRRNLPRRRSASATTTFINGERSVDDDGPIFQTIIWRSIKCVSTF